MIKGIIFDMDGVIVDTEPVYCQWVSEFLENNSIIISREEKNKIPGISKKELLNKLQIWWEKYRKESICLEELEKKYLNYMNRKNQENPIDYKEIRDPQIYELMEYLKEKKYKIAIASSSGMKHIKTIVKECDIIQFIDVFVSGEMYQKSKPDPEIYCDTVRRMNLKPEECIAIEDSSYGIEASKRAGVFTVAKKDIRFGFKQEGADYIVSELSEIKMLLS